MNTTKQIDASERLALSAREVAKLLGVSQRHVWKSLSMGRMPKPFRLGRSVRWNYALLRNWVDAGCPPVERFEAGKKLFEESSDELANQPPEKCRLRTLGEGLIQAFLIMSSLANLVNTILNATCTKP